MRLLVKMKAYIILILSQLLLKAHESDCISLTNMTAPGVQDPRFDMRLHCRFDMGGEELYSVKWYKDDHEFFRYTPAGEEIVMFPVAGVDVDSEGSTCSRNRCDLLLKNITRPASSGSYRCEVSSEAPAFRLASETRNVSVAVLPDEPPLIEGLKKTYALGDILVATCTSGFGDPRPMLQFYINQKRVPHSTITEADHHPSNILKLTKSKIKIRISLGRDLIGNDLNSPAEISCASTTTNISPSVAPSLSTTRTFSVIDHNQIVNNQKFRWHDSASSTVSNSYSQGLLFIFYMSAVFNYIRLQ